MTLLNLAVYDLFNILTASVNKCGQSFGQISYMQLLLSLMSITLTIKNISITSSPYDILKNSINLSTIFHTIG